VYAPSNVHVVVYYFSFQDQETGVLRLWSASRHTPLESINLKSTGFHCLQTLDTLSSGKCLIALALSFSPSFGS